VIHRPAGGWPRTRTARHRERNNLIVTRQDTIAPGQTAYPPLWAITKVTWKPGVTPRLLTSYAAITSAAAAGQVTLTKSPLVVNCPLI